MSQTEPKAEKHVLELTRILTQCLIDELQDVKKINDLLGIMLGISSSTITLLRKERRGAGTELSIIIQHEMLIAWINANTDDPSIIGYTIAEHFEHKLKIIDIEMDRLENGNG